MKFTRSSYCCTYRHSYPFGFDF